MKKRDKKLDAFLNGSIRQQGYAAQLNDIEYEISMLTSDIASLEGSDPVYANGLLERIKELKAKTVKLKKKL